MDIGERSYGSSESSPSHVTPGALAVGATSVMVLCIVLGLFLHGAPSLLLFGVAATLAIYLVLIGGGSSSTCPSGSATAHGGLTGSAGRPDRFRREA